jgi:hypothetical protein
MTVDQAPTHNDIICSSLYSNGYVKGLYSDLTLRIHSSNPTMDGIHFKIHKLLALKSPLLASFLTNESEIHLTLNDDNLSPEGLGIAIGHLYASYSSSILVSSLSGSSEIARAKLLKGVLSAASALRLADLLHLVTTLITADVGLENVLEYLDLDQVSSEISIKISEFLTRGVFDKLEDAWDKSKENYNALVSLFSKLPWELLKNVIESKEFQVPSDMERFSFAKKVVLVRAEEQLSSSEENVLLSFGLDKSKSGVTLVRKSVKNLVKKSFVQPNNLLKPLNERKIWKAFEKSD